MNNGLVAVSLGMLGATVFVSAAQAQRHVGFASAPAGRTGMAALRGGHVRPGFVHLRRAHRSFAGSAVAPYFYWGDDSEPGVIEAPPPHITVQAASSASVPNPRESLVLEFQGDRWVRITNNGQSQNGQSSQPESVRGSNLPTARPSVTPRRTQASEPPSDLPPAVLVFRDGHREEIRKYMIVGTTICTRADYWSSGSWTRMVQVAELDVPATLKLNLERGAKFSLPSGPNEVMIRP